MKATLPFIFYRTPPVEKPHKPKPLPAAHTCIVGRLQSLIVRYWKTSGLTVLGLLSAVGMASWKYGPTVYAWCEARQAARAAMVKAADDRFQAIENAQRATVAATQARATWGDGKLDESIRDRQQMHEEIKSLAVQSKNDIAELKQIFQTDHAETVGRLDKLFELWASTGHASLIERRQPLESPKVAADPTRIAAGMGDSTFQRTQ